MKYLNIELSTLRSAEYVGSSPAERGTWLSVSGFCADQENGGRIVGGMLWKDRQWQQVCGVSLREIRAASRLILIEGDDVVVFEYPTDVEDKVRTMRETARDNGKLGGRPPKKKPSSVTEVKPNSVSSSEPISKPISEPSSKSVIKEKGIVREGNGIPNPAPAVADASAPKPRPRDEALDALATLNGESLPEVTRSAWSQAATARKEIVAVTPDVTPDEIRRRAANYRLHMPAVTLTPTALSKHWARCANPPPARANPFQLERSDHAKGF